MVVVLTVCGLCKAWRARKLLSCSRASSKDPGRRDWLLLLAIACHVRQRLHEGPFRLACSTGEGVPTAEVCCVLMHSCVSLGVAG